MGSARGKHAAHDAIFGCSFFFGREMAPFITDPEEMTVRATLERYVAEISGKKSPVTCQRETRMARMLTDRLGDHTLAFLTPLTLAEYRTARLREASDSIVARDLAFLSQVLETAADAWGIALTGNPVGTVSQPVPLQGQGRRLKPGERARLLATCGRNVNATLLWVVRLAMETAMRKTEILGLTRDAVDLPARVAQIPKISTRSPRQVPLTKTATATLREALRHAKKTKDTPLIFFGEPGKFGTRRPYAIDKIFRQALIRSRLKEFGFNDLRQDAIMRMKEAGLSEREVVAIAGVRSVRLDRRSPDLQPSALVRRLDALTPQP